MKSKLRGSSPAAHDAIFAAIFFSLTRSLAPPRSRVGSREAPCSATPEPTAGLVVNPVVLVGLREKFDEAAYLQRGFGRARP